MGSVPRCMSYNADDDGDDDDNDDDDDDDPLFLICIFTSFENAIFFRAQPKKGALVRTGRISMFAGCSLGSLCRPGGLSESRDP